MKQTAVEWLFEEINRDDWWYLPKSMRLEIINQAIEMEKKQIIESYCQGCFDITQDEYIFPRETAEEYYNETFKSE